MLKDLIKVARRLDSLGLTREADVVDLLVRKIASKDNITRMDAYLKPSESFMPLKSKMPSESSGEMLEGWSSYSQAEFDVWKREMHNVGLAAWNECEELGGDKEDCQRAYALAIYRKEFGRDPEM